MFLHHSDLNISVKIRQIVLVFSILEILKRLQLFANFVAIFADWTDSIEIYSGFSDFVENAEKRCNVSKFLDFNLIFIMIIPEISRI